MTRRNDLISEKIFQFVLRSVSTSLSELDIAIGVNQPREQTSPDSNIRVYFVRIYYIPINCLKQLHSLSTELYRFRFS